MLDIFNTDKKCFKKINKESSPSEIWIRIRFLEINGLITGFNCTIFLKDQERKRN